LSIVQGPFSVAPCQTLVSRFATFSIAVLPQRRQRRAASSEERREERRERRAVSSEQRRRRVVQGVEAGHVAHPRRHHHPSVELAGGVGRGEAARRLEAVGCTSLRWHPWLRTTPLNTCRLHHTVSDTTSYRHAVRAFYWHPDNKLIRIMTRFI
jgi:hypothetical protein